MIDSCYALKGETGYIEPDLMKKSARIVSLIFIIWICPLSVSIAQETLRFGLTAVVLTENLRFLDQWGDYLEQKMGHKIEFVLRKSYRDVMDLLDKGSIDFAWICGYPYIQKREPESIQLMTVPVYRGAPKYQSYIIVHQSSPYKNLADLKDRVFTFSDPDSNSGFLYPLSLLAVEDENPDTFFRQTFFTFNHAETIQAVAEQVADGGAVDSYIWEYLAIFKPALTQQTRIIKVSPEFGFPPIVSRLGVDPNTVTLMKQTLENMPLDKTGQSLLDALKLDKFAHYPDSIFMGIRHMVNTIQRKDSKQTLLPSSQ